jgi:two-component system, chemotaxis family, response regulator Rcp1
VKECNAQRPVEILLVADNRAEATLLQIALLQEFNFSYRLHLVPDEAAAVTFLYRLPPYTNAPQPHLLIVDLHFPHGEGWSVLAAVRTIPSHSEDVPVVLLIGGGRKEGEEQRAQLQPTLCVLKPLSLAEYQSLSRQLQQLVALGVGSLSAEFR